jgi:hypothetical protein
MEYLTNYIGVTDEEAEAILRDVDLWPCTDVGSLYAFEDKQALRDWKEAINTLHALYEFFQETTNNPALEQTIVESLGRAEVMLAFSRARSRRATAFAGSRSSISCRMPPAQAAGVVTLNSVRLWFAASTWRRCWATRRRSSRYSGG